MKFWQFGFFKLLLTLSLILIFLLLFKSKIIKTFLAFLIFFFIGVSAVFVNNDANYQSHYKSFITNNSSAILKIDKVLKSTNYHHKYVAEVTQIDSIKTKGKILLNITKDSLLQSLKVDEFIYAKPNFIEVNKSLNPHQFDYKFYLEKQGIHQQIYFKKNEYKSIGIEVFSLKGLSAKFRDKVQKLLKEYHFKADELAVINALLLGQRQEISKELISDYSKAGAIHILAVSGLHVGIILWILTWLLKPLERLKNGRILKTICIVILLWMFAFIAGLSASVVRAVTMFTFLAIGLYFQRKNVILFSLISSMFFLLIFKPMFLFDVGFQLSYLAVFGIVWIQPKLYKIYSPKYKVDKKIWEIFTVSIAAQIGVLPLSLYYFHQFPGLFMLSNLIIIPVLGTILVGGIVIITGALIGILPQVLANIYGSVISLMNGFINWVSNQEQFLFTDISLSFLMMLISYVFIIFSIQFLIEKSSKRLTCFLVSLLLVQSIFLFENYQKKTKQEFIVFHKNRNSILGNRVGEQLFINHDLDSLAITKTNAMFSYRIGENVNQRYKNGFSNVFQFENETILIVDSLGIYQLNNLKNPIILLQQSPKINLERLIKTIAPKQIITDGSNYKSYVKRWQKTCKTLKTPFHYTGEKGAFIYQKNKEN
jgi:competence protein ComEC